MPPSIRRPIRLVLATWTGVLAILVVSSARAIPTVLLAILLPYLAVVALNLLGPIGEDEASLDAGPSEDGSGPLIAPEGPLLASPADPDLRVDTPEALETVPAEEPRSAPPAPPRPRRKARPRVVAEPARASFVQVGPGRFVRGVEPEPVPFAPEQDGLYLGPTEPDAPGPRPGGGVEG